MIAFAEVRMEFDALGSTLPSRRVDEDLELLVLARIEVEAAYLMPEAVLLRCSVSQARMRANMLCLGSTHRSVRL